METDYDLKEIYSYHHAFLTQKQSQKNILSETSIFEWCIVLLAAYCLNSCDIQENMALFQTGPHTKQSARTFISMLTFFFFGY